MVICMAGSRCGTRFEPHLHVPVTCICTAAPGMVAYSLAHLQRSSRLLGYGAR